VAQPEAFWTSVWEQCGVLGERGPTVLENGEWMPGARWFPQARLNYAENLLRRHAMTTPTRSSSGARTSAGVASRTPSFTRRSRAARKRLQAAGIGQGDRVAAYLPNMPEALIAMLATTSLGAIWSSASPDFGVQGVLDRFGQIEPKVLLCVDGYWYNGKPVDCMAKNAEVAAQMPASPARSSSPTSTILLRCGDPQWRALRRLHGAVCRRRNRICAACLSRTRCSSCFVGHHRRSQVHRARSRRRPAAAPEGTPVARRREA
jgi:hypothetical protein